MTLRWKQQPDVVTDIMPTEVCFTTPGANTWTVPNGVTSVSVLCIGGGGGGAGENGFGDSGPGGGGGGALRYVNDIAVTPGEVLNIQVGAGGAGGTSAGTNGSPGGTSSFSRGATTLCSAAGGGGGIAGGSGGAGGSTGVGTGGNGGAGGDGGGNTAGGAGGGAAGYSGNGGDGTFSNGGFGGSQPQGGGGGGGGTAIGGSAGGGGVGNGGEGINGITGGNTITGGTGGSGGTDGESIAGGDGGLFGGGGGTQEDDTSGPGGDGGQGAVCLLYPGDTQIYPNGLNPAASIYQFLGQVLTLTDSIVSGTIDASAATTNDAFILTYGGETTAAGGVIDVRIGGTSATEAISTNQPSSDGNSMSGIFYIDVDPAWAGNSAVTVDQLLTPGGFRCSIQLFRIIGGAGLTVAETDITQTTNLAVQTVTLNPTGNTQLIVGNGYYSNSDQHTVTTNNGDGQQFQGVQDAVDSGGHDSIFVVMPTPGSATLTYTRGPSQPPNTQGDSFAGVVFNV